MQRKSNTDLKVGLTVLIGLIVLIGGIILAKGWRLDSKRVLVVSSFPTASGIEPGDPVYIYGIKKGVIHKVAEAPDHTIIVTAELFEHHDLHQDATALISMLELMGGKKMEIEPGTIGAFNVDRDTILGTSGGDLSSMIVFVNSLSGTLKHLVYKVDTVMDAVTDMFGNGKLKQKTYGALDNASGAISDLRTVLRENRATLSHALAEADKLATNGNAMLTELRPGINAALDSVRGFIARSQTTLSRADTLLSGVNLLLKEARDNKSLLYNLISDKDFSHRVDSSIQLVNLLLRQMRTQGLDVNMKLF